VSTKRATTCNRLVNRAAEFENRMERAIKSAKRAKRYDLLLPGSGPVKDRQTTRARHSAGDCIAGDMVGACHIQSPMARDAARLGGDEFGLLLRELLVG